MLLGFLVANTGDAFAQDKQTEWKDPFSNGESLPVVEGEEPIVVTATATQEALVKTGRSVTVITPEQLQQQPARTTPEALWQVPGVMVQQTSPGGGSPIIRGLVGPQVLVVVDGIRLNNSTWRTGPVQYLNTISVEALRSIEVLRGSGSVLYGSDALGGVVYLHTHTPTLVDEGIDLSAKLATGYRSAADAKILRGQLDTGYGPVAVWAGGDLADFGNVRGGRETGLQDFTSYRQGAMDAKVVYQPRPGHFITVSYLGMRQLDIPRPDKCQRYDNGNIRDCRYHKEQFLDLAGLSYSSRQGSFFDDVGVTLSLQNSHELSERLRWDQGKLQTKQDDVLVLGSRLYLSHGLPDIGQVVQRLTFGGELYNDLVESAAWEKSLRARDRVVSDSLGEPDPANSTLADNSSYTSSGVFAEHRLLLGDSLSVVSGLRYTGYLVDAQADDDKLRLEHNLNRSFAAPSASLFAEYQVTEFVSLGLGGVHGFRAPNLYDLTGRDHFGGGYEFADADNLGPETITGGEALARLQLGPVQGEVSVYGSLLQDMIVRRSATYLGQDTYEGEPVFKRVNAGSAYIWGAEAQASLALPAHTQLYSTFSYAYGEDTTHSEPLSRIPPPNGTVGVTSMSFANLMLGAYCFWALAQERLSQRDIADSRIPEEGTPAYFTLGLKASYLFLDHLRLSAVFHNILDTSYRLHGSGVDGPGSEAQVRFEILM